MYLTASPTVTIFSASSSGISMSNSSSKAIMSSTISKESAPKSSTKEAFSVTSCSSTPNCSTTISLTLAKVLSTMSPPSTNPYPGIKLVEIFMENFYSHDHAAVYPQHLAGNIFGIRGNQESHGFGHILRRTEPPQGNLAQKICFDLFRQNLSHL